MMWILNQDKNEIIEVTRIQVNGNSIITFDKGIFIQLGFYKDQERALDVLKDIQRKITQGTKFDRIDKFGERVFRESIYEMPKA